MELTHVVANEQFILEVRNTRKIKYSSVSKIIYATIVYKFAINELTIYTLNKPHTS